MPYTPAQVVKVAKAEVGYREGKGNANRYSKAEMRPGESWCADFNSWVDDKAGGKPDQSPNTASCDVALAWFKDRGRFDQHPAKGDWVFYGVPGDAQHTGRLKRFTDTTIWTVEGNTNDDGSPEGDGVYNKVRRRNAWVLGYGHPIFDKPKPKPAPKPTVATPPRVRRAFLIAARGHLGKYPETVKRYQRAIGVKVTGKYDAATKAKTKALNKAHGKGKSSIPSSKLLKSLAAKKLITI